MRTGAKVINATSQIHNSLTVSANQRMTKWSPDISEKHLNHPLYPEKGHYLKGQPFYFKWC